MFERAPKNNIHKKESSFYENEDMLNNPEYIKEIIHYLDEKIKMEQTLGHSIELLQVEKSKYEKILHSLKNSPDNYKDVA